VVQSTVHTLIATVARYSTAPLRVLTVYCVRSRTDRLDADPQAIPQSQFGNYPTRRRLIILRSELGNDELYREV
jgi:hypothetical protein